MEPGTGDGWLVVSGVVLGLRGVVLGPRAGTRPGQHCRTSTRGPSAHPWAPRVCAGQSQPGCHWQCQAVIGSHAARSPSRLAPAPSEGLTPGRDTSSLVCNKRGWLAGEQLDTVCQCGACGGVSVARARPPRRCGGVSPCARHPWQQSVCLTRTPHNHRVVGAPRRGLWWRRQGHTQLRRGCTGQRRVGGHVAPERCTDPWSTPPSEQRRPACPLGLHHPPARPPLGRALDLHYPCCVPAELWGSPLPGSWCSVSFTSGMRGHVGGGGGSRGVGGCLKPSVEE